MKTNLFKTISFLFLLFSCLVSTYADDLVKRACIKDANEDFRNDLKNAEFEKRSNIATCRFGPEVSACMSECLPTFQTCLQPIRESLASCRSACFSSLIATRKAARESLGCKGSCNSNLEFQKAIVQANINFQSCRIACRNAAATIAAKATCRAAHGVCVNACKN